MALLGVVRELHRGLDRVPAGDGEEDAGVMPQRPGERRLELLQELDAGFGGEFEGVPDLAALSLEGLDQTGMTVTEVEDRDPGDPIDEQVAVHVLDGRPAGGLDGDGEVVRVRDRIGLPPTLFREEFTRTRAGRWVQYSRRFHVAA